MFKQYLQTALRNVISTPSSKDSLGVGSPRLISFTALAVLAAVGFSAPTFAIDDPTALRLDSHDLKSMKVFSGEGFVHVEGIDGEEIEVIANVVGGHGRHRLTLKKEGDIAVLVALNTERHFVFAWVGVRPRIDITVKVPSRLALEVRDGPGAITLTGMHAAATVIDDSGALSITHHRGNLSVYDGAGEIELDDVTGNIYIQDGAGGMKVQHVVGNVDINDGNGAIVVKDIDGHVSIHDGLGGVAAANITQGLTINDGRSGRLAMALVDKKDL